MDPRITRLRDLRIFLGTSSWKYPGWRGWFYKRTYRNKKDFNDNSLAEYAEHFPSVGVDHTYYNWPKRTMFERYADQTPDSFLFCPKATERVTVFRFPKLPRYAKDAGKDNAGFLDSGLFQEKFLRPLDPVARRLGPILFEFSRFYPGMLSCGREFVEHLKRFFDALQGESHFRFAVEIRNAPWLKPEYFSFLGEQRISHVFNSWTHMPSIGEQLTLAAPFAMPAVVSRVLLQPGTAYEKAVEAFSPYDKVREEQPILRQSVAHLIESAITLKLPAYVFVNNRAEGCAPRTIEGVLQILEERALV